MGSCAVEVGLTTNNTITRTFENPQNKKTSKKQSTHTAQLVRCRTHTRRRSTRPRHPVVSSASIPHSFAYHITHTHTSSIRPASAQTTRRGSSREFEGEKRDT